MVNFGLQSYTLASNLFYFYLRDPDQDAPYWLVGLRKKYPVKVSWYIGEEISSKSQLVYRGRNIQ